jgi:nitrite reductase/ring-hydroxylating ferredoxin subunit
MSAANTTISNHPAGDWHDVAPRAGLDPDFPTGVVVQGQKIGLFLLQDQVHALEDVCPHAYALLSQGFVEDGVVECPLHAARFEINGGKCLNEMGQRDLRCFPVKVEADRVWVQVPQA